MPATSIAARLVPLSTIPSLAIGTKVRFLGCIKTFEPHHHNTAILQLSHDFPKGNKRVVDVDVGLVLNQAESGWSPGEWVNIIGYIEKRDDGMVVKALMVWSAGGVRLDQYEEGLVGLRTTRLVN